MQPMPAQVIPSHVGPLGIAFRSTVAGASGGSRLGENFLAGNHVQMMSFRRKTERVFFPRRCLPETVVRAVRESYN